MAKKKAKSNPRKDQKKFSIGDYIKDSPQAVEADDYLSEICKTRETPGTSCLREPIHTRVPGIINAKKIADSYEKSVDRVFYKARELMKKGKVLQSWKDRARWVGYLFGVYIRNTPSTEIEKVASFMQDYGTFNYDEELKDDRWLIPITGSFYNDIRANWMAKQAQRMTPEESIDLAEEICRNIICQVRNSYINGFTSSFAVMPKLPDTMDAVEKYLKDFTDDSSRKVTPLLRSEDEKLLYWNYVAVMRFGLLHKQYRYTVFDCMPDMLTNHYSRGKGAPDIKKMDLRMLRPERAISGMDVNELMEGEVEDALTIASPLLGADRFLNGEGEDCMDTISHSLMNVEDPFRVQSAIAMRGLLDRERLFYAEELDRVKSMQDIDSLREEMMKEVETERKANADVFRKYDDAVKESAEAKQTVASQEKKISMLQQRVETLESRLVDSQKQSSSSKHKEDEATKKVAELEKEVEALQAIIESQNENDAEKAQDYDFSIFDDFRVVIVGGHMTWANNMRSIHKNVRVYDRDDMLEMDDDVLATADAIWIQSNCIGHSTFYRVSDRAAILKKQLNFFHFAGWNACRKELVDATKRVLAKKVK